MAVRRYEVGDLVLSRTDIHNDGGVPDVEDGGLLARAGTRGIVVGASGARPPRKASVYLVRFEDHDQILGPPIGCLDEELTQDPSECSGGSAGERTP